MSHPRARLARTATCLLIILAVGVGASACAQRSSATSETVQSLDTPTPTVTSEDVVTTPPVSQLPSECSGAFSTELTARLQDEGLPLNDPGMTMFSSQQASLLEILDARQSMHCTWGAPGTVGISTDIALVDETARSAVLSELDKAGFGCNEVDGTTTCAVEQRGLSLDDKEYRRGETHAIRGDLWVATSWLNIDPAGYTEDVLETVSG